MTELFQENLNSSLIPTKVASEISGYNADYLARLCREKKIDGTQVGRSWLINRASLEKFVSEQDERKRLRSEELRVEREKEYRKAQKPILSAARSRTVTASHAVVDRMIVSQARARSFAAQAFRRAGQSGTPTYSPRLAALAVSLAVVAGSAYASTDPRALAFMSVAPRAAILFAYQSASQLEPSSLFRITEDEPAERAMAMIPPIPDAHAASRAFAMVASGSGNAALASAHALMDEARSPIVETDVGQTAQARIALASSIAYDPLGSAIALYVGTGELAYHASVGIFTTYLSGVQHVGDSALALAATARDGVTALPPASDAILDTYSSGIYALNDVGPKAAEGTVLALYSIGDELSSRTLALTAAPEAAQKKLALQAAATMRARPSVQLASLPAVPAFSFGIARPLKNVYAAVTDAEGAVLALPIKAEDTMLGAAGYAASLMDGSEGPSFAAASGGNANVSESSLPASVLSFLPSSWQMSFSHLFRESGTFAQTIITSGFRSLASLLPGGDVAAPALTVLHAGPTDTLSLPVPAPTITRGNESGSAYADNRTVIQNVVNNYYPTGLIGSAFDNAVMAVVRPFVQESVYVALKSVSRNSSSSGGSSSGVSSDGATLTNVTISSGTAALSTLSSASSTLGTASATTLSAGTTTLGTTTISGDLTVNGTITADTLAVSNFSFAGGIVAPYFTATDTAATSSFTNLSATNADITSATLGSLTLGGSTFTSLLGTGLVNAGGALSVSTTSFSGVGSLLNADLLDGLDSTYLLSNAFSTTSASNWFGTQTTDALAEGTTNLYFTDARARSSLSASYPLTYSTSTGAFGLAFGTSTSNTWGGTQTFINAPVLGALTGFLKATAGVLSTSLIDLSTDVSSTLAVSHGGTGSTSLTGILKGDGTNPLLTAADGTDYLSPATIGSSFYAYFHATTTDALAEGTTNLYFTDARARSAISSTATGLSYNSGTGAFSLAGGYIIPFTASTTEWNSFYTTPSSRIAAGTNLSWAGNTLNGPTDSYMRSLFSAASPLSYDSGTGALSFSTSSLTTDDIAEGAANLYFTSGRATANFISNLAATTSVASIASLPNLSLPLSQVTGTLAQGNGGTGIASYNPGDILYADNSGVLSVLPIGGTGQVLKVQAGLPQWGVDNTIGSGGGGDGVFATSTGLIYPIETSSTLVVGSNATSTANSIFEVAGQAYISSKLGIATTSPSAQLSVTGNGLFSGTLTAGNIIDTGLSANALVYVNGSKQLATTTVTGPLSFSSGVLSINQAGSGTDGYLSSADWNTFNGKQNALTFIYPLIASGPSTNIISLAFGTTTANTWSALQTFNGGASTTQLTTTGNAYLATAGGKVGIGTTSPSQLLSVQGNAYVTGTATIGTLNGLVKGTNGVLSAAVSGTDYAPATSGTSLLYGNGSGGFSNATVTSPLMFVAGNLVILLANNTQNGYLKSADWITFNSKQDALTFTYPLLNTTNTISLAFGTTTANTWSALQTFNDGVKIGSLSGVLYGANGTVNAVATSTASLGTGLSGTLTTLGSSDTLSIATSSLYAGSTGQVAYFNGTNTLTGTSSLFLAANGNAGIGTTSPATKLDVNGTIRSTNIGIPSSGTGIEVSYWDGNSSGTIGTVDRTSGFNRNTVVFGSNVTLGIGSTAGSYVDILNINSRSNSPILFSISSTSSDFFDITHSGNVGIGTTSPTNKFEVAGNSFLGGNLTVSGTATIGTLNGLVKGTNGVLSAAVSGTDFAPATSGIALLYGNGSGGFSSASVSSPLTFVGGTLGIQVANSTQPGYLSSTDWSTFNGKQDALTFSYPLLNTSNTISLAFGTTTANTWSSLQTFNGGASTTQLTTTGATYLATAGGNVGIGTTSPSAKLSVAGNVYLSGNLTADGTVAFIGLGSGLVKSTSGTLSTAVSGTDYAPATSGTALLYGNGSGGFSNASVSSPLTFVGGTLGIQVANSTQPGYLSSSDWTIFNSKQNALTFTYPLVNSSNTVSLAFGTTTANAWSALQTFNGGVKIASLSGVFYGVNGTVTSVATSTATLGLGISYSGITFGRLVGGTSGTLSVATSSLYTGSTGQLPYFSGTNALTGTSSLFIASSGNVGIGTTSPSQLLSVQGNAYVTGTATIGTLNGLVKGTNGVLSAAVSGTDYAPATSGTALLYGNGSGGFSSASVSSPLTFVGGTLGIQVANSTQPGYLSSTDWSTFNGKQDALTFTYPLVNTSNTVSLAFGTTTATLGVGLSGTLTTLGASDTLSIATSSLYTGSTGQVAYFSGTNALAGSSALTISGTNVGIGTTSPAATLEIGSGQILIPDGSASVPSIAFSSSPSTGFFGSATAFSFSRLGTEVVRFGPASTWFGYPLESLVAGNGFLIDTGSGANAPIYTFRNDTDTGVGHGTNLDELAFFTGNTNRALIDANGNVGIGTTSPFSLLSVAGNTYIGGDLTATGTVAFTGLGSGLVKSTSGTLSTAVSGTDYAPATSGTSLLAGNGSGGFSSVSISSPLTLVGGFLGIQAADNTQPGYLSSTDWSTFNGKQDALTFSYPLLNTSNTISLAFGTTTANTWSQVQTFASGFVSQASSTVVGNLNITGKYNINGTQVAYLPNQSSFLGSLFIGNGGTALSHASGVQGQFNTALGIGALASTTSGSNNTAIGYKALYNISTSTNNVAVGDNISASAGINKSVLVGSGITSSGSGTNRTLVGFNGFVTKDYTVGLGDNLDIERTGGIAIGSFTSVFGGDYGIAIGNSAYSNGTENIALGVGVFTENPYAIGIGSGAFVDGMASLGIGALAEVEAKSSIAIGYGANGGSNSTGYGNISIGASSTPNLTEGSNTIAIGNTTWLASSTAPNQLNIGNIIYGTLPATTTAFKLPTSGAIGIGTSSPYAKLSIAANNGDTASTLFAIGSSTASATSTLFSVTNSGNVGIGTTSPTNKLEVNGNSLLGGNLAVTGTATIGTLNGLVKGTNGVLSAAISGTDYAPATSGTALLYGNGSGGFSNASVSSPLTLVGGTLGIQAADNTQPGYLSSTDWSTFNGKQDALTFSYPLLNTSNTISLAFGTTTANTWSSLQTFASGFISQASSTVVGNLNITGKYNINGTQVAYLPDQTNFAGSLFIGDGGGSLSHSSSDQGQDNTALGIGALSSVQTGAQNTAIGSHALTSSLSAPNTAVGAYALYSNVLGYSNVALGDNTLFANSSGYQNTVIGSAALEDNTSGNDNAAIGAYSLSFNTTGSQNAVLGSLALANNITGSNNVAIGFQAANYLSNGTSNASTTNNSIYIGVNTRAFSNSDTNSIVIGYTATGLGSNSVVLGNDSITKTVLKGNVGIGTTSPYAALSLGGGNLVIGGATAAGTKGDLFLPKLGTAAGAFLAVDANGKVIATTTSSGGVASVTATYPLVSTGGTNPSLSIAFGTTTANTWSSLQTFTSGLTTSGTVTLGSLNGVLYGVSGVVNSIATSTAALGLGLSYSGTLGSFVDGTSGTLSIATSSLYSGTTGQVPYFNGTNTLTGTSSIEIDTDGTVSLAPGINAGLHVNSAALTYYGELNINDRDAKSMVSLTGNVNNGDVLFDVGASPVFGNHIHFIVDQANQKFTFNGGNVGIGTTSPYAQLAITGDLTLGAATAGGTPGDLFLPKLGTAAGSFLAVDATGKVIATTTPTGGGGGVTAATYPLQISGSTVSLAFGTTTANTWSSLQTFNGGASTTQLTATGSTYLATAGGKVGIGTTSPRTELDVYGSLAFDYSTGGGIFGYNNTTGNEIMSITRQNTPENASLAINSYGGFGVVTNNTSGSPTTNYKFYVSTSGNVGIGTTSPYAALALGGGDLVLGAAAAGGTPGDLYLPKLGTAAGAFLAVDANGKVIATTTPAGSGVTAATYPLQISGSTVSLAFGTTTANTWSSLQTFGSGFVSQGSSTVAGNLNITGSYNVNGTQAVYVPDQSANLGSLFIGDGGASLTSGFGEGTADTGVGIGALAAITSGFGNTGIGYQSLYSMTGGVDNTAVGLESLYSNNGGNYNTAIGKQASYSNTTGTVNTSLGYLSLYDNTTGDYNTALGASALANSNGSYNTAVGYLGLQGNSTGEYNAALGYQAGAHLGDGTTFATSTNNSLYLGVNTKAFSNSDTNSIVIGYDAIGLGSNSVVLGNDSITTTALKGDVGIGTTSPYAQLAITGDLALGAASAGGTPGDLFLPKLGTSAGAFLAVDANGKVIATTTPAGGGGSIDGSGTANGLAYWSDSNTLTSDADLTFDGSTLTIGSTLSLAAGLITHGVAATTTIADNQPYAWTLATSTTAQPLLRVDTSSNTVAFGTGSGDVTIGDVGATTDLVFEEDATIRGQTGGRTITMGATGDIFNFGVNTGFGTSSPYAAVSVGGGNLVLGAATAGGTPGDLYLPKLGAASGKFLAVDASGKVIATTTPAGGGGVTTATYPLQISGSTVSLAFGTTTANTWSALQTFASGFATNASSTIGGAFNVAGQTFFGDSVGIGSSTPYGTLSVQGAASGPALSVRGAGSNDIQEWRTASGALAGRVDVFGTTRLGVITGTVLQLTSNAAGSPVLTVNAVSPSQTADIMRVGTNFPGRIYVVVNAQGMFGVGTTSPYALVSVHSTSTATTTLAVSAMAGQTANLVDFYNTSGTLNSAITAAGNWGIGTSAPTAQLHTTGTVRFSNFGAGTLTTDASGNVTVSSDERLKNIDGSFSRGLADLQKLSPILYRWNALSGLDQSTENAGFSAQNVQSAIPEAVNTDPRGYLTLTDRPILAASVNAIKELAGRTDTLSLATTSLSVQLQTLSTQFAQAQASQSVPRELTATSITADSITIAKGVSAGTMTAQSVNADGTVSAARYVVPQAATTFTFGSTTISQAAPTETLTSDGVDLYKLASYAVAGVNALSMRTDLLAVRIDDIESRLAALETLHAATSTDAQASGTSLTMSTLQEVLKSLGLVLHDSIAMLDKLVTHQLVLVKGNDGTSSTGSDVIPSGSTKLVVQNPLVHTSSKIFLTFTSSVNGSWYLSEKKEGSFTIQLARAQSADVVFDYFILQTDPDAQIAAVGATQPQPPDGSVEAPPPPTSVSEDGGPVVTLTGDAVVQIPQGADWIDPGATAKAADGTDLTGSIAVSGSVDAATPGNYTLTYAVTDATGKQGSAARLVSVLAPTTAPSDTTITQAPPPTTPPSTSDTSSGSTDTGSAPAQTTTTASSTGTIQTTTSTSDTAPTSVPATDTSAPTTDPSSDPAPASAPATQTAQASPAPASPSA